MHLDLNAKKTWNCRAGKTKSKTVLYYALKHILNLIYPDAYSLCPYNSAFPSTVETAITRNINWNLMVDVGELNSDHLPVIILLSNFNSIEAEYSSFPKYK